MLLTMRSDRPKINVCAECWTVGYTQFERIMADRYNALCTMLGRSAIHAACADYGQRPTAIMHVTSKRVLTTVTGIKLLAVSDLAVAPTHSACTAVRSRSVLLQEEEEK